MASVGGLRPSRRARATASVRGGGKRILLADGDDGMSADGAAILAPPYHTDDMRFHAGDVQSAETIKRVRRSFSSRSTLMRTGCRRSLPRARRADRAGRGGAVGLAIRNITHATMHLELKEWD